MIISPSMISNYLSKLIALCVIPNWVMMLLGNMISKRKIENLEILQLKW